jgi:BASS family bile acid:Na+ symporter
LGFAGPAFGSLVLLFVASTMLAVGLGTSAATVRRTVANVWLLVGALAANLVIIPALGWGLAELLLVEGPSVVVLTLAAASPGGPYGAKLAQLQRGEAVAGAALMSVSLSRAASRCRSRLLSS